MENHHVQWENPLSMVIFNSYVKLPEGSAYVYSCTHKCTQYRATQLTISKYQPFCLAGATAGWVPNSGAEKQSKGNRGNQSASPIRFTYLPVIYPGI